MTIRIDMKAFRFNVALGFVTSMSLLAGGFPARAANQAAPLMSVPQPVLDLYYGDALFYFYQDDYFRALVHLDAATSLGRVANHQTEAELIKGALYLSLGQHTEAGRIFEALLNDNVALGVRNRAWFYLAKLWYQRGYFDDAQRALQSIQGELAQGLDTERHMLYAQVLLNQGQYQQAITALQKLDVNTDKAARQSNDGWLDYARFNLGVALVRQGRDDEANALLDRVGQLQSGSAELLALRDKANLALGFNRLRTGQAAEAERVLQRVRLTGPQSNKALLGLGWAHSSTGKYREALAPWLELKQRDLLDAAVQEAYLAIPYAYAQLQADGQAAEYYNFAIDSFNQESARLDESIAAIRNGSLLNTVLENDTADQSGWYWQLRNLPDAPETRYLYDLLASNTFQEALKNYRDLKVMQRNLDAWMQSMSAFQDMVDTRRLAFAQRTNAMQQALDVLDMESLEARTVELEARLNAVEQAEDAVALATSAEQANWLRVLAVDEALKQADSSDASVIEMQDKTRLLRGVLYWEMNANYKARLWRQNKAVRELSVATKEARRRHTLVARAREQVPQRNEEFAARVSALAPQLQALAARCESTGAAQSTYLATLAIQQLEQQKQRLAQYALQAQFALASIYDRAAVGGAAGAAVRAGWGGDAMSRMRIVMLVGGIAAAMANVHAADNDKPTGTLKDLAGRKVDVAPQIAPGVTPEQAAAAYRRFLELQNASPQLRVEAMRRLGDLNIEANENALADSADETLDSKQLQESIELYEGLLKSYPQYASSDAVLYQLARAYEASGKNTQALSALDKLVTQHPGSRWFGEGQFRRGEILFSAGRYADAAKAYAAVVNLGNATAFYDQGLYKHGWALFKQGRADESAASFMKELDRLLVKQNSLRDIDTLSRAERELADDTLRVLSIMASDEDGPDTLSGVINRHGDPGYAYLMYASLGDLYLEKERYQDAAQAFTAFAKRRPDARQAPTLEARAIEAYQKGGFAARVLEAKQQFVERYAFEMPFWKSRRRSDAPEVAAQLQSNLQDLAQYYHAQSGKSRKTEDYNAATRWYRSLLNAFPDDAAAPGNRYLLAELLFDAGRYAEATQEYEYTAYRYAGHARSAAAGYAALVAYQKHEPTLNDAPKNAWHRQFIDSAVMFAASFPQDTQAAPVLTKAAEDLFALNEFDRTIEVARQLLERQPPADLKQRRTATTLMAHSLFDRARYPEAEAAYLNVRQLLPAADPDLGAIDDRIAASIYKQAEIKQAEGNGAAAVDDFLRVVALAPSSKISANAEFDAATLLITRNNWPRAIAVLEQFRRAHPAHELESDVGKKLAVGYQETGRGMEAAAEYERIAARREETPEIRRAALTQAAELYMQAAGRGQAGAVVKAATIYTAYVAQYPQPFDAAMEARQHLVELAAATQDSVSQLRWYKDIIAADKNAGAARTDRSKYLAARATLFTAQPAVLNFNAAKLTAPLPRSLKIKRAAMEAALAIYGQALDYQVAEVTTEATFGIAELYRQMGADVLGSERPKNLDADALEQYNVLLEEQAFPFEEKAIALHQSNVQRAGAGIYDEWVKKSYAVLARLVPARYARNELSAEYVGSL